MATLATPTMEHAILIAQTKQIIAGIIVRVLQEKEDVIMMANAEVDWTASTIIAKELAVRNHITRVIMMMCIGMILAETWNIKNWSVEDMDVIIMDATAHLPANRAGNVSSRMVFHFINI